MKSVMAFMSPSQRVRLVVKTHFRHFCSFSLAVELLN